MGMDSKAGLGAERVLLSGASGMLGTALRTALEQAGVPVVRLVRHAPATPNELQWDPAASQPIRDPQALEGITAAIHLSGANVAGQRWTPAYRREITESRVNTTHALASLLARHNQPPRALLAASATGFYGDRGDEVLTEESTRGTGFLAELCQLWEEAALPAAKAGIRVVHLRFGVVLGRGSGALGRLEPLFRLGLGGRLGSGRQWMSWIVLDDAVAAVRFLLAGDIAGPVNLVAPQPVTNADFTQALADALRRPAILPAPAFALRLALGQMAKETLLASARVVPGKLNAAGFQFGSPDIPIALAKILSPDAFGTRTLN